MSDQPTTMAEFFAEAFEQAGSLFRKEAETHRAPPALESGNNSTPELKEVGGKTPEEDPPKDRQPAETHWFYKPMWGNRK